MSIDRAGLLGTPLFPSRFGRRAALLCAVLAALILVVLAWYTANVRATPLDVLVDDLLLRRPGWLDAILSPATELVGPVRVVTAGTAFGVACLLVGEPRAAALAVGGPVSALLVTELLLKPGFDRPPVMGEGDAFPSGHATAVSALAVAVLLVIRRRGPVGKYVAPALRVCGLALALAMPCYLTLALASFRHHYVTDIIGGIAVAVLTVLVIAVALDMLAVPRPRAHADHDGDHAKD